MIGVKAVRAADGAIEFSTEGSSGFFYDISTELQKSGLDWWLAVLFGKSWFTDLVRQDLIDVWHSAKVYVNDK